MSLENFLKEQRSEFIQIMTHSLEQGQYDRFDVYYGLYQTLRESMNRHNIPSAQPDILVKVLYKLRIGLK